MSWYPPVTVFASALVLPLTEADIPDQHATIDHCRHIWARRWDGALECEGRCGVVLHGELARRPCGAPTFGMPWPAIALVVPMGRMAR